MQKYFNRPMLFNPYKGENLIKIWVKTLSYTFASNVSDANI